MKIIGKYLISSTSVGDIADCASGSNAQNLCPGMLSVNFERHEILAT
jgi:hypothetical protein